MKVLFGFPKVLSDNKGGSKTPRILLESSVCCYVLVWYYHAAFDYTQFAV